MGLAVGIGLLEDLERNDSEGAEWLRRDLARLDVVLAENGLPAHVEPETFARPMFELQGACTSFPYSFLHYLRRAFAHVREGLPVPDDEQIRAEHESVVDDAGSMLDSHLLVHSDAEGYYVPVEIGDPIFDDDLPGSMLGSSQALLRELIEVAPHIGVTLADGRPIPECIAEIRAIEDSGPFWRERVVWDTLFEAATLSVAHHTLIAFH
jgi:hypothetical protein